MRTGAGPFHQEPTWRLVGWSVGWLIVGRLAVLIVKHFSILQPRKRKSVVQDAAEAAVLSLGGHMVQCESLKSGGLWGSLGVSGGLRRSSTEPLVSFRMFPHFPKRDENVSLLPV